WKGACVAGAWKAPARVAGARDPPHNRRGVDPWGRPPRGGGAPNPRKQVAVPRPAVALHDRLLGPGGGFPRAGLRLTQLRPHGRDLAQPVRQVLPGHGIGPPRGCADGLFFPLSVTECKQRPYMVTGRRRARPFPPNWERTVVHDDALTRPRGPDC